MRVLHFDASCGAGGDMIVGALIDAGAPLDIIREGLMSLHVSDLTVSAEKIVKHGIAATQFTVHTENGHHEHRHLGRIIEIIDGSGLPSGVRAAAADTFRRIAECEARIHATTPDNIHFHEVGAVDSIADIVGAHLALSLLNVERVTASPLNVGAGEVHTRHGILPVPAPATALLLEGVPCYGSDVCCELVTPTGAALIAQWAKSYGPLPEMRIETTGYGSGTRDLSDRANVLRAFLGNSADTLPAPETIIVIEANIDDMNPELFPPLIADLLAKGARDAFLTAIMGKKGRPAYLLTTLCDEVKVPEIAGAIFRGSTTFGVRMRREQRLCLEREWKTANTPWGDVRVKLGHFQGRLTSASPEFEDCRRAAEQHGAPVRLVYESAQRAAIQGETHDV